MFKYLLYIPLLSFTFCCSPKKKTVENVEFEKTAANKIIYNKDYLWDAGTKVKVYFHHGDDIIQQRIISIANRWSYYGNISFVQTKKINQADLKISFRSGGYSSYIGTMAARPTFDTTMCLQDIETLKDSTLFTSIVLHEFGHALGCLHEHQSPDAKLSWQEDSVYLFYESLEHKWDTTEIMDNIISVASGSGIKSIEYDTASIMHYPLKKPLTKNGFEIVWKGKLSEKDKEYINLLYPKNKKP